MRWARGQTLGQRLAALEDAHHIQHHGAKIAAIGELGHDRESAVERHAGVQQRGQLLGEEQHILAVAAAESGKFEIKAGARPLAEPDIHRDQALAAQLAGHGLVVFGGKGARAGFAIGGDSAEKESGRHQNS